MKFIKATNPNQEVRDISPNKTITPLHIASNHDFGEGIGSLLERGANPLMLDSFGCSPMRLFFHGPNHTLLPTYIKNIIQQLPTINRGTSYRRANQLELFLLYQYGEIKLMKKLLQHRELVDEKDSFGISLLYYAMTVEDAQLTKLLLEHHASLPDNIDFISSFFSKNPAISRPIYITNAKVAIKKSACVWPWIDCIRSKTSDFSAAISSVAKSCETKIHGPGFFSKQSGTNTRSLHLSCNISKIPKMSINFHSLFKIQKHLYFVSSLYEHHILTCQPLGCSKEESKPYTLSFLLVKMMTHNIASPCVAASVSGRLVHTGRDTLLAKQIDYPGRFDPSKSSNTINSAWAREKSLLVRKDWIDFVDGLDTRRIRTLLPLISFHVQQLLDSIRWLATNHSDFSGAKSKLLVLFSGKSPGKRCVYNLLQEISIHEGGMEEISANNCLAAPSI